MRSLFVVLFLALVGCDDRSSPTGQAPPATPTTTATAPAGMNKYPYLAADGGPHMLLPSGVAGVDYNRACALTANAQMALMPVGSVSAMILADPPMTASGSLTEPDALLLFAGDTPTSTAYGVHRMKIPAGSYKILTGTFSAAGESVTIYRLKAAGP